MSPPPKTQKNTLATPPRQLGTTSRIFVSLPLSVLSTKVYTVRKGTQRYINSGCLARDAGVLTKF
jgi:hypothetical protein